MPVVSDLFVYPIKSLKGIRLEQAQLNIEGLKWDRHWMITDANFKFVTQRQLAEMALISVNISDEHLTLSKVGLSSLTIDLNSSNQDKLKVTAQVWRDSVMGFDEGDEVSEWLTQALGMYQGAPLRLVRKDVQDKRAVDPEFDVTLSADTDFSDGFPYLVATEETLSALNKALKDKAKPTVDMARFRPNIVLSGAEYAWQEYDCNHLKEVNGLYQLALCKPCQRCPITTIDQQTAEIVDKKEPLTTLSELNPMNKPKGAYFGQNAVLLRADITTIRIGDEVSFAQKQVD
ncbi:MOSC N-terminal beta barrel domain-containing protein [Catenovulum sp. SM1970]|uniref:MOSC domain-containing protein n=1 Tax=Marinifaba aquimaris TaxID=2741323 RepID=UPI001574A437|nr:MOSC N-terminal beta barrel domain-containing protein [Marinifaba aquimaris]NTS77669.1 MOSC N-terminal beta barrel domain-containing protein [Marinifaba aquimaris]